MPSSSTPEREGLLRYLEGLFALAQVVTSDAEEAVRLVEDTYEKAFRDAPAEVSEEERRVWLYRLLLQRRSAAETEGHDGPELTGFRRRLATEYVDHALPTAFASLSSEQRLLLMLCDVQDMERGRAAEVLELDDETTGARLEDARDALHAAIFAGAAQSERHLLDTGLSGDWMRAALQRMAESELVSVPPTLRPAILSVTDQEQASEEDGRAEAASTENGESLALSLAKRAAAVILIVAVAGLLGYGFSSLMQRSPKINLISLSASQALEIKASFQTSSAEQAERYVYDRIGRRVTVPNIERAALQGVTIRSVANGAEVPVLVYSEVAGTARVVVYVYSYAFLDRFEDRLVLENDILKQIEEEGNFNLHDLGDEKALIWRRRDDILVAITTGDAEELRQRISYPA